MIPFPHLLPELRKLAAGLAASLLVKVPSSTRRLIVFAAALDVVIANAEPVPPLLLNREFLSDNVIKLLREARQRASDHSRDKISPLDLLISLFTTPNSIVAECFERIGVTAAKLTELAVMAEQQVHKR